MFFFCFSSLVAQERWVLRIHFARVQDTGIYKCEVNSIPKVYETRMVMVMIKKSYTETIEMLHRNDSNFNRGSYVPDEHTTSTSASTSFSPNTMNSGNTSFVDRSFYECCQTEGVPILCRPLCSLNAMISDQTKPYMFTLCYNYMAHIFRCISDGRNHLPCCQKQQVPKLCQPSCSGRYSLEKALDHAICHEHSKTILFCISDGLQVLPEQPQDLQAEAINSTFVSFFCESNSTRIDLSFVLCSFFFQIDQSEMGQSREYYGTTVQNSLQSFTFIR